jgi:hypothetical protein
VIDLSSSSETAILDGLFAVLVLLIVVQADPAAPGLDSLAQCSAVEELLSYLGAANIQKNTNN